MTSAARASDPPRGIIGYAGYVPRHRLARQDIAATLGSGNGKKGARAVAYFDQDTTTLGVEAARLALRSRQPPAVFFATTQPAYMDKTNATVLHAALDLDPACLAVDVGGAVRSGVGALWAAAHGNALAVLSDIRIGLPGSEDEAQGGDAAAAFLFGEGEEVVAELVAMASRTAEFLDRWRAPTEITSRTWEERFGVEQYMPLVRATVKDVLQRAGLEGVDQVLVTSPNLRAARAAVATIKATPGFDIEGAIGYTGAAHAGLQLADALDQASAGETILLIVAADGCDALLFKTTPGISISRPAMPLRNQLGTAPPVRYADYLTWRGLLEREPPRRPTPRVPAAPPAGRNESWKFALVGARCTSCGTAHVPPQRVCMRCGAVDQMAPERFSNKFARVATFSVDRLAFSEAPPLVTAVLDFDGGGRIECELSDIDREALRIGDRVAMSFRKRYTVGAVPNYCWKAVAATEC